MDIIIPTCLADIPLYQMQEYEALEMEAEERTLNAVAIFCSLSLKEVSKLPIKILNRAIENIKGALEEKPKFQPRFKYKGIEYGFIPNLDELSTGEFIDLDTYQKDKTAIWKMMSVLYRPIVQSGQNERYLIEPYSGKLNDAFKEMPCDVAFGCLLFFLEFRSRFNELYPELFAGGEAKADEHQFNKKWGWMGFIHLLTDGDVTKFDGVSKLPIHTTALWGAYKTDLAALERAIIKKQ